MTSFTISPVFHKSCRAGLIAAGIALLFASNAHAFLSSQPTNAQSNNAQHEPADKLTSDKGRVTVEWINPKKFTDTRPTNMSSTKHREHLFKQLEEHLEELAEQLPAGQSLSLSVTDVDLAGRVEPGAFSGLVNTMSDVRIIREIDSPRLKFSYQLFDANGAVLKAQDVSLKDMSFMSGFSSRQSDSPYVYEKRMLTKWFKDTFSEK